MLELRVARADLTRRWQVADGAVRFGASRIEPFRHKMLETCVLQGPERSALLVRERGRRPLRDKQLGAADFRRETRAAASWPLQYCLLIIDHARARLTLRQGRWGVAPVYLVDGGETLHGHWDPASLYPLLERVDLALAARFLATFDMPYARATLFPDLCLLTAEAEAAWGAGGRLRIAYPPPQRPPVPRRLRADAAPAATALAMLEQSIARWLHDDVGYGSELSAGLDSSLVSIALGRQRPNLRTFGLMLDDAPGQDRRRRELIAAFGFRDTALELRDWLPLAPDSPRWAGSGAVPWEETYAEAVNALLARAAGQGVEAMFTGFGGDELCPLYATEPPPPAELAERGPACEAESRPDFLDRPALAAMRARRPDRAPNAVVDASAIESAAFGSALYLRHGIWPIHPLCTPELARFCNSLPWDCRAGRAVERAMLRQLGCPASVWDASSQDSFLLSLASSLRDHARDRLRELFAAPRLAQLGLVEPERLRAAFADWCAGGEDEAAIPFYSAAILELALQRIGRAA